MFTASRKRTYLTWRDMNRRCHSPTNKDYKYYGARGIVVCDRWRNAFDAFIEDMGEAPSGLTLDRVDNDLGYSKENCRWATRQEQSRNNSVTRMLSLNGVALCLSAWAIKLGVTKTCIRYRLSHGWSMEKALTTGSARDKSYSGSAQ